MTNAQPLANKTALVTGGSRGIGAAIAKRLAADGASVVVNYGKSAEAAEAVVHQITQAGGQAKAIQADVGEPASVRQLVAEAASAFGEKIDILVNNAGTFLLAGLDEVTEEHFDKIVDMNVKSVFTATVEAAKKMPEGGRVTTIGSVNADRMPFPTGSLYSLSKAAVQGMTRGWARDFAPRNITVNTVQPGPIDTDMNPADGDFAQHLAPMTALGRYGTPTEVAALVAFLASPEASYITGAALDADGGFNA